MGDTSGKLADAATAVDLVHKAAGLLFKLPLVIVLLALCVALIYRQVRHEVVAIEPFECPEDLAKRGWSGKALANALSDHLNRIEVKAKTSYPRDRRFSAAWITYQVPDVRVESVGLSTRAITEAVGGLLRKRRHISGEVMLDGEVVGLRVREANSLGRCYRAGSGVPSGGAPADEGDGCLRLVLRRAEPVTPEAVLQELLSQAAEDLYLESIDPIVVAAYHFDDDPEKCREALRRALTNSTTEDDAWAYNLRGLLLRKEGHPRQAIMEFRRARKTDPRFVQAYNNWALVYIDAGERVNEIARRECYFRKAHVLLSRGLAIEPWSPSLSSNLGRLLCMQGRCEQSLRHHKRAVRFEPENPYLHFNRALALNAAKRYDKADEAFEQVQLLAPDDVEMRIEWANRLYDRALALNQGKRYDAADEAFGRSQFLGAHNSQKRKRWANLLHERARSLDTAKQYDRADAAVEQAEKLAPIGAKRLIDWADRLFARNREVDHEKARGRLEQASKLDPSFAEPHERLGNLYRQTNRAPEAIAEYREAIKLGSRTAETFLALGDLLLDNGTPEEAAEVFMRCKALQNAPSECWCGLSKAYRALGRPDEAAAASRFCRGESRR